MDAGCKDCTFVVDLRRDVEDLKGNVDKIDTRLQNVEKSDSARNEQIKSVNEKLDKIDKGVDDIKKSNQKFITGIISGVTITVITAFILQTLKIFHW